jgi:hypothetical protein
MFAWSTPEPTWQILVVYFCDSLEVFGIPSKLSEHLKNFHDSTSNQYWMDKGVICMGLASELDTKKSQGF